MKATKRIIHEIVDSIEFRFLQPMDGCEKGASNAPFNLFGRKMSGADLNISFAAPHTAATATLAPLAGIRGMSTLAIAHIIHQLTRYLEDGESYVNVGVWKGFTFLAGVLNKDCTSIGIDNFSEFGGPKDEFLANYAPLSHARSSFHELDYVDYFRDVHTGPIGFYFYDGEHSYENQLKSLEIAEPFLSPNAIILVDDTNHPPARDATLDFLKSRHRQYEVVLDQFTAVPGHPTFHNGLMLVRRV
jgi:predicted O-methyltransferase YrrM